MQAGPGVELLILLVLVTDFVVVDVNPTKLHPVRTNDGCSGVQVVVVDADVVTAVDCQVEKSDVTEIADERSTLSVQTTTCSVMVTMSSGRHGFAGFFPSGSFGSTGETAGSSSGGSGFVGSGILGGRGILGLPGLGKGAGDGAGPDVGPPPGQSSGGHGVQPVPKHHPPQPKKPQMGSLSI